MAVAYESARRCRAETARAAGDENAAHRAVEISFKLRSNGMRAAGVNGSVRRQSPPTEHRGDVLEDALEHVRVVVHSERVRDGQEQRIRGGNRLVRGKFLHELVRLRSIRTAEDGARGGVDVADLIALARIVSKVH